MTTDTTKKLASRTVVLDGATVTLTGICKGSGMIAPQLATMIAVVVTDCAIDARRARRGAARAATPGTFEQLVIDGDMSTNDSVFVLANGCAGNPRLVAADSRAVRGVRRRADRSVRRARPRHRGRRRGRDQAARGPGQPARRRVRDRARHRARRSAARRWSRRRCSARIRTGAGSSPRSARAPARRASTSIRRAARSRSRARRSTTRRRWRSIAARSRRGCASPRS